jgi:hypothetical protein
MTTNQEAIRRALLRCPPSGSVESNTNRERPVLRCAGLFRHDNAFRKLIAAPKG